MDVLDGRILRIDLSTREVRSEAFSRYAAWLGGQGVNQFILFQELPLHVSPFSSSNIIVLGAGLLVGTSAAGANRLNIDTLSPITGGIASSNVGGNFARELRLAGTSNVVIRGQADGLVYLCIEDERVEIIDATHLRLKTVSQSVESLHRELGDEFKLLLIGPAGENRARSACVIVDGARAAGRCGIGAVFGAKNIKAIAVRGTGSVEPRDRLGFSSAVRDCLAKVSPTAYSAALEQYGVYYREGWSPDSPDNPYRNFSGRLPSPDKTAKVRPDAFTPFMKGSKTCGSCPMHCWKVYEVPEIDKTRTTLVEALQMNSIDNFAAKLDLFSPESVLRNHGLCNELGLDEDNAAGAIAWAFECYDRGLITKGDTGGLELEWGNEKVVRQLLEAVAYRQGFGDVLAEGSYRASKRYPGTEECSIHVKGQELFESIWASPAWALGTIVAARGGTHTRGAVIIEKLEGLPADLLQKLFGLASIGDKYSYENKERLVVFFERMHTLSNSLGICYFMHGFSAADMLLPEDYARLVSTATARSVDATELMQWGERIFNLEKCFNVLHTNWTREDDMPPDRFVSRALDGRFKIDKHEWEVMLDRYYRLHGWDESTGKPKPETLDHLGMPEIRMKLEQNGKLP